MQVSRKNSESPGAYYLGSTCTKMMPCLLYVKIPESNQTPFFPL